MSPARCLQELHGSPGTAQGCRHSPGVQSTAQGCRAQPRGAGTAQGWRAQPRGAVWPKASVPGHPFGSRNPFALLGWCCSHAGLRCPRVLQPHPAAQHGCGWARVGMGSPEEQEQGNRDTNVGTHDRSALGPELGCRWTHQVWQKVMRNLHHPTKQSPLPLGVLQAKARQCCSPKGLNCPGNQSTEHPKDGRGSCAVGHWQHPPQLLARAAPLQRETAHSWLDRLGSVGGRETPLQAWGAEGRAAPAKAEAQGLGQGSVGSSKVEQSFSCQGLGDEGCWQHPAEGTGG